MRRRSGAQRVFSCRLNIQIKKSRITSRDVVLLARRQSSRDGCLYNIQEYLPPASARHHRGLVVVATFLLRASGRNPGQGERETEKNDYKTLNVTVSGMAGHSYDGDSFAETVD